MGEGGGFSERFLETLLRNEVRKLNLHLPKTRKTLAQLLKEEEPSVEALDGSKVHFKRRDLENLAKITPPNRSDDLRLPLVFMRRGEMGEGAFTVMGGELEREVVRRVLGLKEGGEGEIVLYRVQIQEILSHFRSVVTLGFSLPSDLEL